MKSFFKCHGGKYYLSKWIISYFPRKYKNYLYIEPYAGGASVLLNKKPSYIEIINDLNPGIYRLWKVLKENCDIFADRLKEIKYTEENFELAKNDYWFNFGNEIDMAINEFVLRRMSRGGLCESFAWSERKRGGKPGDQNAWENSIKFLPILSSRIKKVNVHIEPAIKLINRFNLNKNLPKLIYADPPYLDETRVSKTAYGEYEMSCEQHINLAKALLSFDGKVLISGYRSALYDDLYKGWLRAEKAIANHASQRKKKQKKIECLWMNY